jgi:FMN phosphatase YigB (HAD superfamily)
LLRDKALVSEVLLVFVRVVSAYHRRRARHRGISGGQTGAVTAIQRVGSFANANVHFHTLVPEGVWHELSDGSLGFHPLPPPTDEDVEEITTRIVGKLRRLLARRDGDAVDDESDALGHRIPGADVLGLLSGEIRPEMVMALDRVIRAGYRTACLTNNVVGGEQRMDVGDVMVMFDHVVESSKVGCRKPEPRFYQIACELVGVDPSECVFLDDLGINLKPAREMGMTTIKVGSAEPAIAELELVLGIALR